MEVMMINGGSAVPLWNTWLDGMQEEAPQGDEIDVAGIQAIFARALEELDDMSGAKVGDKTMMDAIIPANQAIAAYADRDETTAQAVVNLDDVVDELFVKIKHDLTERITHQEDHTGRAVDLIIIAKYLERIADHAVNIANWAIFCVTGQLQ